MPAGTFLVKPENTDIANPDENAGPAGLRRNPFIGGGGDIGGQGDSLFQRLELERMFDPPRDGMQPIAEAQEEESVRVPEATFDEAAKGSPQHQDIDVPLRRTSHSYVPARPSRLSNSMTPQSANNSMSSSASSGDASAGLIRETSVRYESSPKDHVADGQEYDSQTDSEDEHSYQASSVRRTKMRRFSGQEGSMRDVEFTFSPSPIRKRPSAQTLVTHTSHSSSGSLSPASGQKGKAKPPFRLFQRRVDTEGYDTVQTKAFIEQITVGGTPLKDLVNRAGGVGMGSPSPLGHSVRSHKARVDSGVSSVNTSRRRHLQLAKQWSTSSGSGEGTSGSFVSDGEERSEVEERSSKRIRLSKSLILDEHVYQQSPEYIQERSDEQYDYSASGSEDARDQRSLTALSASQSRTRAHDGSFQHSVEPSSASEAQEDAVVEKQGQRRSWNEKGQEVMERIRQVGTSDQSESLNSWSRSSTVEVAENEQARQGEGQSDGSSFCYALTPAIGATPVAVPVPQPTRSTSNQQYGTVTSSNSGGTASSTSTITSRYLSAGINMLEKIKERKVSDSSGTGACTDVDVREIRSSTSRSRLVGEHNALTTRGLGSQSTTSLPGTASSQSTIRGPNPASDLATRPRDLNGTAKSGSSTLSRSSLVASLGKGTAPAVLRTIIESPSASIAYPEADQTEAPEHVSRLVRSQQEDMNRYISSTSTANTATTAVSTSFVKHRGPPPPTPHGRAQGVRTIGLNDIPQIPRQVGNMVYDPERGWMRASKAVRDGGVSSPVGGEEGKSSSAESVDIFADMESLREDERTHQLESSPGVDIERRQKTLSPVLEVSVAPTSQEEGPADVEQENAWEAPPIHEATSTNRPDLPLASAEEHRDVVSSMSTLSLREPRNTPVDQELPPSPANISLSHTPPKPPVRPELREHVSAPTPMQTDPLTPAVRSILKTGANEMSARKTQVLATPLSAMKIIVSDDSARRSVSFSDGRTYGKILEASAKQANVATRKQRKWDALAPEDDIFNSQEASMGTEQGPMQPSVRSKRIQNMLVDLSHNGKRKRNLAGLPLTMLEASDTPSKVSQAGSRKLSLLSNPSPSVTNDGASEMSFTPARQTRRSKADATFLTECSFGVAHDRLVEVITEVQPYEAHWELLSKIDLSKRGVDSVARLKEFCPDLDEVNL